MDVNTFVGAGDGVGRSETESSREQPVHAIPMRPSQMNLRKPRPTETGGTTVTDWTAVVVWMGVILVLSSDTFNASQTGGWFLWFASLIGLSPDSETFGAIHLVARKAAHFFEYAILGILAARACGRQWAQWHSVQVLRFALALVVLWASVDEFHQSFLASRTGSPIDVALDSFGGATGAVAHLALRRSTARAKKNGG